jgi:hypothetical protein
MEKLHEVLRLSRKPRIDQIVAALEADPDLNQTHLAAKLGCGRNTIRKYRRMMIAGGAE